MFVHLFIWQAGMLNTCVQSEWGGNGLGWGQASCGLRKGPEEKLREAYSETEWQDLVTSTHRDSTASLLLLGFLVLCSAPVSQHEGHTQGPREGD